MYKKRFLALLIVGLILVASLEKVGPAVSQVPDLAWLEAGEPVSLCYYSLHLPVVLKNTVGNASTNGSQGPTGSQTVYADFNGDGCTDLAIGVPYQNDGDFFDTGAVNVLYGSADGLAAVGDQLWHQDIPGVEGMAGQADYFGEALAAGDFNEDGFIDLAIGVPNEAIDDMELAGAVNVLYGSANGLTAEGDQIWHQNSPDVEGAAEYSDGFGGGVTVGDFNGDGFADLAIGVPNEDVGDVINVGAVNILYGSLNGLTAADDQLWDQDSPDVEGFVESGDRFGDALTTGDFNRDGFGDLAIGVPWDNVSDITNAGATNVLYGSLGGLTAEGDQIWSQASPDVAGGAETSDRFGNDVTAGDFNGDGYADLAIGVRYEAIGDIGDAGAVNILYGSGEGLTAAGDQIWHQDISGVVDTAEPSDFFGGSVTTGDFNRDGFADLAIGVVAEDVGDVGGAGSVSVLYGSVGGLTVEGNQIWSQGSPDVEGGIEADDNFGHDVTAGDFNGDGYADLAIGVRNEDIADIENAGAVNILYGSEEGLTAAGDQIWDQDSLDVEGEAERGDGFGYSLR